MDDCILSIQNISKRFAGVLALQDVSFEVRPGEIHALMGENGAGKSTMIKILTGLYHADSGKIFFDGQERQFKNVLEAQHAGLAAIYQELNMVPNLSVSENIFISRYPMRKSVIDWELMHEEAQKLVDTIGVDIDVRNPLKTYGTAKQQIVAILRAVSMDSKLVIMDEPTSSLDSNEVKILFEIMDKLKKQGIAIIFISHRLEEVYEKSDSITVLKDGNCMGTYKTSELSQMQLLEKMIGNVDFSNRWRERSFISEQPAVLEARNLTRLPYVNDVSFSIGQGEVVGFAGLLGSGRTETARIVFGCDLPSDGKILVEGKPVTIRSPKDAVKLGMAFCTENRREEGLFSKATLLNNMTVCALPQISRRGFIDTKARKELANKYMATLSVKAHSCEQLIKDLSGGNQQKVILARWLATNPKFIILDEPTRGIDVGAKREIELLIQQFSNKGIGVLFISSEISELVRNCDRVIVLRSGSVAGELTGDDISEKNIMKLIASNSEKKVLC